MKQKTRLFTAAVVLLLLAAACSGGATDPAVTIAATAGLDAEPVENTATPEPQAPTATDVADTATPLPATEAPTAAPTKELTPTSEPTVAPTIEPTAEPTSTAEPPPEDARAQVSIAGFQFSPGTLSIRAGTTVVWTNNEGARHTVTSDDGSFASDVLNEGDVFSFTFDTPGSYAYYCRFHGGTGGQGMSGVVTVTE